MEDRSIIQLYWDRDDQMLPGSVSKILERERKQLKSYLTERGFEI